jgi:chemotaxis signal transduction protein
MSEHPAFTSTINSSDYAQFLAQMDDAAFWEYAVSASHSLSALSLPQTTDLLLCTLQNFSCLLPLMHLREILSSPLHFTSLPKQPIWMLGLMAWCGETIPILDLSAYLMQQPSRNRANDTLLITEYAQCTVGWLVSSVEAIPASLLEADAPTQHQAVWYTNLPAGIVIEAYANLPLLDLSMLITEAAQCIGVPVYE